MKLSERIKQKLGVKNMLEAEKILNIKQNTLNIWLCLKDKTNSKVEIALLKAGIKEDTRLEKRLERLKQEARMNEICLKQHEETLKEIRALLEEIEAA